MRDLTFKTLKTIFSYYKGETLNNINYYLICIGRYIILPILYHVIQILSNVSII